MNNTTPIIGNKNINKIARISTLLESLRHKVHKFSIRDRQNQLVGEVKDLIIDANRQISFIVNTDRDLDARHQTFLLSSKLVEKIDSQIKCIFLKVKNTEIRLLETPVEKESKVSTMENHSKSLDESTQDTSLISDRVVNTNDGNITSVDEIVRLLGERVIIDRKKRKVGEVIVRKQVETRMVQVPVRNEKLIVEQVSPERKQLAEIDLRQGEISAEFEFVDMDSAHQTENFDGSLTVSGEFSSPKIASLLLNAIALERNHGCKSVKVTIVVEDEEDRQKYQEWFARTSKS
ncbi:DUF2382 domain-containing protein [Scytonema sp. UIC 10036]|uniref:DUF2382 domain-containing protein n=1 Tax=Scytonema sp. UIC 10036 TaxID=2304196 RepID=UPI0012DA82BC|nr:DUF2382 domain-containing protein [Scytonema sp. UIC 10036]MUG96530.1 DUF2382 domain-containing protein [Scytonema sp. UIC 10036]